MLVTNQVTGIHDPAVKGIPTAFTLHQNFPNPFNPVTSIRYAIPTPSEVRLEIYDILGRRVATLVHEMKEPGSYDVKWDASGVSSGIYFYRMRATNSADPSQSFSLVRKLVLLK